MIISLIKSEFLLKQIHKELMFTRWVLFNILELRMLFNFGTQTAPTFISAPRVGTKVDKK